MFFYILLTPMGISFAIRRLKRSESSHSGGSRCRPHWSTLHWSDIKVDQILGPRPEAIPEQSLTVRAFAENWLLPEQHDYVVVDHGKLAGIVSLSMLAIPSPQRVGAHAPCSGCCDRTTPHAYSGEYVEDALQRMIENSLTVLPVSDTETDEFVGSISSHEVLEMIVITSQGREI